MTEQLTPRKEQAADLSPLVSIVAPCYNAEKYLEEALKSIFSQDYTNVEVIIVDDGSTDNSYAMLEALQNTYDFQLFTQTNQGVSAALNHGLKYANGKYVSTPDLDDIMLPESVRVRADYLDKHPEVGCVGALVVYMDSEGNNVKTQKLAEIQRLGFDEILSNAIVVGAPVSLYRMDALRAAGFYEPSIKVQDFQMTLKIADQGYQIHVLPISVTRYRRHPNNLSRRYKVLLDADMKAISPYQSHPGYEKGRTVILNKALKYAVVTDKKDAWRLLRAIPLRRFNKTTFRRLKRLLLHR
ncbi:glycosyltransferase family 2 protein [Pseudomonas sp. CCI3.2]|uniref:glycosyltransferase family 2 protein n=2 Tax=Pseudomonas TaxID=286 RepID=UPI002AC986DB|nr:MULTISPECIES: glycosyltransferase family 2 protein [unclassified Pseudomonas]MEB0078814.1 glycosyltransferase family 2 protein [Pseudomonas sp. MH10out]MEB0089719.1 glycosyltransferase family 2 protein [Pseudomonas sp. CCI4.2]MEB0103586.1 glycosyltransferase family 2 protein [Pseudomonas sp. CCI3.2]MEB0129008.1 glycosyltransferase family 2 protein [Pseudomonas sp. CCI2.4]MEB0166986.1 glycosyltransferase family 2 protein [Pseudomonas sp. CCC4.4]